MIPKAQFIKEKVIYWDLSKFKTYILENTIKKIKTRENVSKAYNW